MVGTCANSSLLASKTVTIHAWVLLIVTLIHEPQQNLASKMSPTSLGQLPSIGHAQRMLRIVRKAQVFEVCEQRIKKLLPKRINVVIYLLPK